MAIPVVAIVGRPNVGKSALFNRLARRQISLVHDRPGVTRDRIIADCTWQGKPFTLIDTGGIGLEDQSGFEKAVQREVALAVESATQILLVVDGRAGLHPLDEYTSKLLRRSGKPLWLLVNKLDTDKQDHLDDEFSKLGISKVFPISALHGSGIREFMGELSQQWEENPVERPPVATRIAIVGRPNVGKSTLINALTGSDRLIVSPTAGTTRDAIDIGFRYRDQPYTLIDTAGMRKKSRVADPLERLMTGRSAHAINRAHVCIIVIDATAGVSEQEQKIAGLIRDANRPCVIAINKWDLADETRPANRANVRPGKKPKSFLEEYREAVLQKLFFIDYARVVFLSAQEKSGLGKLLESIAEVREAALTHLPTSSLNRTLARAMESQLPPIVKGRRFKLYYATQVTDEEEQGGVRITAFVNDQKLLDKSYHRYLEKQLRAQYPCTGCPIQWHFKEHEKLEVKHHGDGRSKGPRAPRKFRR